MEVANGRCFLRLNLAAGSVDNDITARIRSFDGVLHVPIGAYIRCDGEFDGIEGNHCLAHVCSTTRSGSATSSRPGQRWAELDAAA